MLLPHLLSEWFSTGGDSFLFPLPLPPEEYLAMCEDFCTCHNWGGGGAHATDMSWLKVRDSAIIPSIRKTASHQKDYLAKNVNSTQVEKPWSE